MSSVAVCRKDCWDQRQGLLEVSTQFVRREEPPFYMVDQSEVVIGDSPKDPDQGVSNILLLYILAILSQLSCHLLACRRPSQSAVVAGRLCGSQTLSGRSVHLYELQRSSAKCSGSKGATMTAVDGLLKIFKLVRKHATYSSTSRACRRQGKHGFVYETDGCWS